MDIKSDLDKPNVLGIEVIYAMPNPQRDIGLLLPLLSRLCALTSQGESITAERQTWWTAGKEGRQDMNSKDRKLRDALVAPLVETTLLVEANLGSARDGGQDRQPNSPRLKGEVRKGRNPRGVYEKSPGVWYIRYVDCRGRYRREKTGTKGAAIDLYRKRKHEALMGKKLPEKLRRATVTFADIARDALAYSKANKLSYRNDACRMENLFRWFRESPADAITALDIERRFEKQDWKPATANRYRALLSLTYRLAIRNGKVTDNPARLVQHRLEDNARIRFLSPNEETALRKAIEDECPEHLPEFVLALNTGLRVSEQYGLTWADVSPIRRILTIPRSKNGSTRHVALNQAALRALEELRGRTAGTGFVCGGAPGPRRWFEPALKDAKVTGFSWHCLRHTFASRLVMAGVDLRTVQELLGHKCIAMTVRYSHLAPKHTLNAVERLDTVPETPTGTTTDTGASGPPTEPAGILQ
jgi:site-specific recombinase XerD